MDTALPVVDSREMRPRLPTLYVPWIMLAACGSPEMAVHGDGPRADASAAPAGSAAPTASVATAVPSKPADVDTTCVAPALTESGASALVDAGKEGPNAFCVAPREANADAKPPCFRVDLGKASLSPITATAGAVPPYVEPSGAPLLSPDGHTRVELPKAWPAPVKSYDVKSGRLLGSPKLSTSAADMPVNLSLTHFVGDTLVVVYWLEPSGYAEAHLYEPRTWKQVGEFDDARGLTDVHVDGKVWAFVPGGCPGGQGGPPKVTWMDVATGAVAATLELPWSECSLDPARVFEGDGRIGIVSTAALGQVAVVDERAHTLVQHLTLPTCAAPKK